MDVISKELIIGLSTGWFYAKKIFSLFFQKLVLQEIGANCVEFCLDDWDVRNQRILSLENARIFNSEPFIFRSVHLPDFDGRRVEIVRYVVDRCQASVALIHPLKIKGDYPTENYRELICSGVPLAVENIDLSEDSGFKITDLKKLVKVVGCFFVLDVQHAYEHDHSMKYAASLLESLEDRLVYLHISGEAENINHSLVYKATNASKIVEFVSQVLSVKKVPLILEGMWKDSRELKQEIDFLTRELRKI